LYKQTRDHFKQQISRTLIILYILDYILKVVSASALRKAFSIVSIKPCIKMENGTFYEMYQQGAVAKRPRFDGLERQPGTTHIRHTTGLLSQGGPGVLWDPSATLPGPPVLTRDRESAVENVPSEA
jgi:hypothetical protein